mmetsp:Transcript_29660/g.42079  ORF Transcript_29660/g.42079 Transcript_29660/m.42079 type:complete len:92 (+) Transcript_29660:287-562(+)
MMFLCSVQIVIELKKHFHQFIRHDSAPPQVIWPFTYESGTRRFFSFSSSSLSALREEAWGHKTKTKFGSEILKFLMNNGKIQLQCVVDCVN